MPGPEDYKEILKNDEFLIAEAKKIYAILKKANPKNFNFTEDDFINTTKDTKKRELFKKSNEIDKLTTDRKELREKYTKSKLFTESVHPSARRPALYLLDTEDSLETDIKNLQMLNGLTTENGAIKDVNRQINELTHFDFTKLDFKSDEDLFDFYKDNYKEIQEAFVFKSTIGNSGFHYDQDVFDYMSNVTGVLEGIKGKVENTASYASVLYLVMPEGITTEHITNAISDLIQFAYDGSKVNEFINYVNRKENKLDDNYNAGLSKLIEDKILDKDFLFKYKTVDEDNAPIKPSEAIAKYGESYLEFQKIDQEKNPITFEKYLENKHMDKMFQKRSEEEIQNDKIKKLIESEDTILTDNEVKQYVDNKMNEFRNLKGSAFGRSTRRVNAVKQYMEDLFAKNSQITINGKKPDDTLRKMLAVEASKVIQDIHSERSGWWNFWHPTQKRKEEEFVDGLGQYFTDKGLDQRAYDNSSKLYDKISDRIEKENEKANKPMILPVDKNEKNLIPTLDKETIKNIQIDMQHRSEKAINFDKQIEETDKEQDKIDKEKDLPSSKIKSTKEDTEEVLDELDFGDQKLNAMNKLKNLANDTSLEENAPKANKIEQKENVQLNKELE